MWIGDKIRFIRVFRGMTQRELGLAVGFPTASADIRIAQYESGTRTPKEEILSRIATALDVSLTNFYGDEPGSPTDLLETFFWLEEDEPSSFEIVETEGEMALRFRYGEMQRVLAEWKRKREARARGEITAAEYTAWKLGQ